MPSNLAPLTGAAHAERNGAFFRNNAGSDDGRFGSNYLCSNRVALVVVTGLVGVGALLRLNALGAKNLWLDEMWSLVIARMNLKSVIWSARMQDPNAALYNVLLHFWIRFGQSESMVRGLSVVFGIALIPVIYLLGRDLLSRSVGLLAAALVALNLFHIQYSQEARAYSLVVVLVTLSSLCFTRWVQKPGSANWVGYVLFSAFALYAHIFAVLVLASHVISLVFFRPCLAVWKRFLAAGATTVLLTIPLGLLVYERTRSPFIAFNWIPRPTIRRVYDLLYSLAGNANYYGIEVRHSVPGRMLLILCIFLVVMALVTALKRRRSLEQPSEAWRFAFLLIWLLFPIVVVLGFSILVQSWFVNRYLLICLPGLLIAVAQGLHSIRPRWLAVGLTTVAIALNLAGLPQYYRYRHKYQEWSAATQYVLANSRDGDAAAFSVGHGRLLFEYYRDKTSSGEHVPTILYPDLRNETTDPSTLGYFPPLTTPQLGAIVSNPGRIWLFLYPEDWAPGFAMSQQLQAAIAAKHPYVQERKIYTVILRLYSAEQQAPSARAPGPVSVKVAPAGLFSK